MGKVVQCVEIYSGDLTGAGAATTAHWEPLITDSHIFDEVYGEFIYDAITLAGACSCTLTAYSTLYYDIAANPTRTVAQDTTAYVESCNICSADLASCGNPHTIAADLTTGTADGRFMFSIVNGGMNAAGPFTNPRIVSGALNLVIALGATPDSGTCKLQIVKIGHKRDDALSAYDLNAS